MRKPISRHLALLMAVALAASACVSVERVTLDSNGNPVENYDHRVTDVSHDGRYVVFQSGGAFDPTDTNGFTDIYVRDTLLDTTERVTYDWLGGGTNQESYFGKISDDGRYVTFHSFATDIVPLGFDGNGVADVFLRDLVNDSTVSITFGSQTFPTSMWDGYSIFPDIAADGSAVVWESNAPDGVANDTNSVADIFRYDVATGTIDRVSISNTEQQANGGSADPTINDDGEFIAFASDATNLTSFADTNSATDVFVRALDSSTVKVSTAHDGAQLNAGSFEPVVSGSGGRVAFSSSATNVVPAADANGVLDVYLAELVTGNVWRASLDEDGNEFAESARVTSIDRTGNRVLMNVDNTYHWIRDIERSATDLATRSADGDPAFAGNRGSYISGNGQYVAFSSILSNLPGAGGSYEGYLVSYPEPEVIAVSGSVARGTTANVTITGERFETGSTVFTELLPNPDVAWSNVVIVNHTTITATATVAADARLGNRLLAVRTPDGGPGANSGSLGTCQCLVVTP